MKTPDKTSPSRYKASEEQLTRALKSIPLGSQTFSKSTTQYPLGVSPLFIQRGKGSHVWDVDGNEYIDFVNSLAAVTLGYNDPDVTKAVKEQLDEGVIFSLPHPIETKVAEKLIEMIPCAEKVRFGKNGSDATAGAIRLSRACTGRDHVAVCGYHGWQDWFIGSTSKNKGVPKAVQELTHAFQYNNIESLSDLFKTFPNQMAAVILEPMNSQEPKPGFLEEVKELARKNGALLIFDEMITGFRYANGGGQEYFGVTPDLATFGKGMANGYPLSAVVGKDEYMKQMEEIFFSFTFGGEVLSLAASLATLTKYQTQPVIKTLKDKGAGVVAGVKEKLKANGLDNVFSILGHPSWSMLVAKDQESATKYEIQTFFLQEIFKLGILTLGSHNMSFSHSDEDVEKLLGAYDVVFPKIRSGLENGKLSSLLGCEPLKPLFKVR